MQKGKLYLIPNTLGSDNLSRVIPPYIHEVINTIEHYIVENIQTAAKFLKLAGINKPLRELTFYVLNAKSKDSDITAYLDETERGKDTGLISEAGLPAVADPGAAVVAAAHRLAIPVVPLPGASSLLLALAASGLNGQSFAFVGYLPQEAAARLARLKELQAASRRGRQTQLLIETPYRNAALLGALLEGLADDTRLAVSCGLSLPDAWNRSDRVADWRRRPVQMPDRVPAVFAFLAG